MSHKHCFFCGEEISNQAADSAVCHSPLNFLAADTVGNKHHAWADYSERARLAAARARGTVT